MHVARVRKRTTSSAVSMRAITFDGDVTGTLNIYFVLRRPLATFMMYFIRQQSALVISSRFSSYISAGNDPLLNHTTLQPPQKN